MSTTTISDTRSEKNDKDFFHQVVEQTHSIGDEISRALKSIKEANSRAHMLSTTAKIEANRTGDVGRDFLVVSNSIDELSTKTDDAIDKMKKETIQGIEKLASVIEDKAMSIKGNRLANFALSNINIIDRSFFERAADIRWWATDDILVNCLSNGDSFSDAENRLKIMLKSYSVYHDLILCDATGHSVATGEQKYNLSGRNFSGKTWFKNAMGTKDGTEYGYETVHKSPSINDDYTVTFSCKVHQDGDPQKQVIGVLAAIFNWKTFAQQVVNDTTLTAEEKDKTRVLICDNSGNILADTKEQILQEPFNFTGRTELFKKPQGFTVQKRNEKTQLISHALSPGYEGYCSSEWHSIIVQEIESQSDELNHNNSNDSDDSLDSVTGLVVNLADETQKAISEINQINDQTQILSLNAAIEAARVGDAGKGFGVISGFMGDISRQTAQVTNSMHTKTQEKIKNLNQFLSINSKSIKGERLQSLCFTNIDYADRSLYERTADVRWWATDHSLYNALTNKTEEKTYFLSNRLRTILQYYTVYEDLLVYDVDGNLLTHGASTNDLGQQVSKSNWFQNVRKTSNGSNYSFDVEKITQNGKDKTELVFSCKIHKDGNPLNESIGYLAIVFKWDAFAKILFNETPITESERKQTSIFIVDAEGSVLALEDNNNGRITSDDLSPFLLETKNSDEITKDDFNWLIGNAASVGFEGFSTGWHCLIVVNDLT